MLKVESLETFKKFKNDKNPTIQSIVTDETPKMEEVEVSVQKLVNSKINQVPNTIVKMVDVATQTETVTDAD